MNGAPLSMSVARLVANLEDARIVGPADRAVAALVHDSRAVQPGSAYVALPGAHVDGHAFVAEALAAGASTIVIDSAHAALAERAGEAYTAVVVPQTAAALSPMAATFYGNPSASLSVIGITGTNGKTTTAALVAAILDESGIGTGRIGTLGAEFRGHEWPLANTTPLALELQALLAGMKARGARAVAMEVSSHALALQRVEDVRFRIAVLTNVTRDHLDFHGSMHAYAAAKRRLLSLAPACVVNSDDAYGKGWAVEARDEGREVVTYGSTADAGIAPHDVVLEPHASAFTANGTRYSLPLPGRFNVWNALAAIGVAHVLDIEDTVTARALAALEPIPGRMERVAGGDVTIVVDYAHTPDALENALEALRETTSGRLAVVFGCGGGRDRGKRAEMGEIAARLADRLYITSDNPRAEDPRAIAQAIVGGVGERECVVELDRRRAIERAVAGALPGDTVLIAGKGHETYQIVGERVLPFDDAAVAREALAAREVLR